MPRDIQVILFELGRLRGTLPEMREHVWEYHDPKMVALWGELTAPCQLEALRKYVSDNAPLNPTATCLLDEAIRVSSANVGMLYNQ